MDNEHRVCRSRYDANLMYLLNKNMNIQSFIHKLFQTLAEHGCVLHYGREINNPIGIYIKYREAKNSSFIETWVQQIDHEYRLEKTKQMLNVCYYNIVKNESDV